MIDPRLQKWARTLIRYSLELKPDDTLLIFASELASPLVREVYREALRAGAFVDFQIRLEGLSEVLYSEANDQQLIHMSPIFMAAIESYTALLSITASRNTKEG